VKSNRWSPDICQVDWCCGHATESCYTLCVGTGSSGYRGVHQPSYRRSSCGKDPSRISLASCVNWS
jgi:hypothetical protein